MRRLLVLPALLVPVLLALIPATLAARNTAPPPPGNPASRSGRPTNLLINGDFETGDVSPWTTFYPAHGGGRGYITTSPVYNGSFALRLVTNGDAGAASGIAGGGACPGGVRVPVQPNTSYTWSGWIQVPPGTSLGSAYVRVAWYAATDCAGGGQLGSNRSSLDTDPNGTWVHVTGTAVSPGTAAFAEVRLLAEPATAASITLYFDDITLDVTPPTPTVTPTGTPTATPTPRCPGEQFADTCPTDWYYPFVTDLAGLGAISGYGCGGPGEPCYPPANPPWFRPNSSITRAQVCKVVVLAYAFPLTTTPQVFTDVPLGHPFFDYINTAASNGLISGYTCGGPGEPCDPQYRPYFRPNSSITRAQLSKIVVLARGWNLIIPPDASFTDVPGTHPFYAFVETASAAHIISGYQCGGPGEPCDPQYRHYFRPNSSITRAQTAKMIDQARTQTPPTPTRTPSPTRTEVTTSTPTPAGPTATVVTDTPTPTVEPPTATVTGTPLARR